MSSISSEPPTSTPSFVLKNVTVDDTDSSLKYSQGWNRSVSSSAHGGAFQSSDNIGDVVSFSLPANATAVYYFGFKQTSGALYEACLDCSTGDSSKVDVVDGQTDEARSEEPTLLYEKTDLDPTVPHSLALLNVPDSRFGNQSTITVDSFVVTVRNEEPLSSISSSSSTSSSSTLMSSTSSMAAASFMAMDPTADVDSPTMTQSLETTLSTSTSSASVSSSSLTHTQEHSNLSSGERAAQKLRSPLVLTGVILAALFVTCTVLYAVMYFMRRRKRRMTAPGRFSGNWTTRFFGEREKDRTSGEDSSWSGPSARPRPPPVSQLQYRNRQRSAPGPRPGYYPFAASRAQVSSRTIPRSAFPSPPHPRGPPGNEAFRVQESQPLVRAPSNNSYPNRYASPSPGRMNPTYNRVPSPQGLRLGPGPGPSRNPSFGITATATPNPYVAEARARVRDRTRFGGGPNLTGPLWQQGPYAASGNVYGTMKE